MLDQLVELAHGAGAVLLRYYGTLNAADADRKGGRRRDLVSAADVEAERWILERIPAEDEVLAEESGRRQGDSGRLWVVDPLDGTINFLHGLPFWSVAIALVEDGELAAGVVFAPVLQMTFAARRGGGTTLDGRVTAVSEVADVSDAILSTGFPYARDTLADNNLENVPRVGAVAGGLRRLGSAALDLALVSCGRLDGFWELHLEPWDVAAGILLVNESGGRVTDFSGNDDLQVLLHGRNLVATNGQVHTQLRSLLAPLRDV